MVETDATTRKPRVQAWRRDSIHPRSGTHRQVATQDRHIVAFADIDEYDAVHRSQLPDGLMQRLQEVSYRGRKER